MDEKEYLEQIAGTNRPMSNPSKFQKLLSSKFFIVGIVGLGLFIIIMIIGALVGNKGDETSSVYSLKLKVDSAAVAVSEYRPSLESSVLDTSSVSLSGVLATTSRDLGRYLDGKIDTEKDTSAVKLKQQSMEEQGVLMSELYNAKTNGVLDSVYAQKIAHEVYLIISKEESLLKTTGNSNLKSILTTSYNSLNNLYDKFSTFSKAK